MLEVGAVNASYGAFQALWDVSLRVNAGEIVALIGPNGAGKTTLLRTIAGLHRPSAGSIVLEGTPTTRFAGHELVARGVALVPEGRKLFGGMTVLENLEMGAYTARARRERARTLAWVQEIFPVLAARPQQIAATLSGGMQQMLAIGRALMSAPRLLLLDEPSLSLAPLIVQNIFDVVRRVNRNGVTVLLVEQNVRAALDLAHRAYVLERGRVVKHGTGAALLHDPDVRRAYLGYAQAGQVEADPTGAVA